MLLFVVAILLIHPVVELATDDDWSYARTALEFASTGHFVYNGWATAMLGWQVIWGALFIKLFGFSYLALRASTILTGAASAFLFHRVLLRFGVPSASAMLGTLVLVLSPLFLPMATSFMTDVPSILCLLLCVYGCQRALMTQNSRNALLWLCGSALLNVLDGTIRQIVWLGALVMIPSAFWLLRRHRGFLTTGSVVWVLSALGIFLFMRWFQNQPYSLPEHIIKGSFDSKALKHLLHALIDIPLDVLLFCFPVLVAWLPRLWKLSPSKQRILLFLACCMAPLILWLDQAGKLMWHLPPWTPNIVTKYGILWSLPLMGEKQEILGTGLLVTLSLLLVASILGCLLSFLDEREKPAPVHVSTPHTIELRETLILLLPFCASYIALLIPRAIFPQLFADVYDRYYIPLICLAVILLLRLWHTQSSKSLPLLSYAALFLFSLFSVAATHDTFAGYRATNQAIEEILSAGVAPNSISGSWEFDGANQIATLGHINEDRLVNPPGSYHLVAHPPLENCDYWFGPLVPAIHPLYVVVSEPLECLEPSDFPPVSYQAWLSPYTRQVFIQANPEELRPEQ